MASHHKAVIGNASSFWLYSSRSGFDLTHPARPDAEPIMPRVTMKTSDQPVAIDPAKSALVIVDMQNFFLSPAFGRSMDSAGQRALQQLSDVAIPAARKAGIRVLWVNWGLTQQEVDGMPPAIKRAFGFAAMPEDQLDSSQIESFPVDRFGQARHPDVKIVLNSGKDVKVYKGLGEECGIVVDPATGEKVDAGKLLMRDQWNAALCTPLDKTYEEGSKLASLPDVWIHKNRMSGLWGVQTELGEFLEKEGLKTLLFTGVNTDQCVSGTLTDAFSKGYDCILLSDGAATTSPEYAQQCIEYNSARTYGFAATCKQFAEGVEASFAK